MRAGLCKTGTLLTHAPCRSMPLPAALVQAPRGGGRPQEPSLLRGVKLLEGHRPRLGGSVPVLCMAAAWFGFPPCRSVQRLGIGESMGNVCSLGGLGPSCIVLASRKETRGTEQHDSASGAALWLWGQIISWDKLA